MIKSGVPGAFLHRKRRAAAVSCLLLLYFSNFFSYVSLNFPMRRRRRPNPESEQNIRRIDTKARAVKQTHGFQVHFLRGDRVVTKMFSDSLYGGKNGARRAARKFKRAAIRRLPKRKSLG